MADKPSFTLSARNKKPAKQSKPTQDEETKKTAKATSSKATEEPDDSADDDDILAEVPEKSKSNKTLYVAVLGVILVVLAVMLFLLFGGKRGGSGEEQTIDPPPVSEQGTDPAQQEQNQQEQQQQGSDAEDGDDGSNTPAGLGTQDFTANTTMQNGNVLTNPDEYVKDLYGLTTRVDYTVDKITYVADFVSYEKHRGTWGGGLELYWLDATYKGQKYVVQVPFQYYKELDEIGIVPVKMEVLTIDGSVEGETLSVISYMCLDEETLQDILKTQGRD